MYYTTIVPKQDFEIVTEGVLQTIKETLKKIITSVINFFKSLLDRIFGKTKDDSRLSLNFIKKLKGEAIKGRQILLDRKITFIVRDALSLQEVKGFDPNIFKELDQICNNLNANIIDFLNDIPNESMMSSKIEDLEKEVSKVQNKEKINTIKNNMDKRIEAMFQRSDINNYAPPDIDMLIKELETVDNKIAYLENIIEKSIGMYKNLDAKCTTALSKVESYQDEKLKTRTVKALTDLAKTWENDVISLNNKKQKFVKGLQWYIYICNDTFEVYVSCARGTQPLPPEIRFLEIRPLDNPYKKNRSKDNNENDKENDKKEDNKK